MQLILGDCLEELKKFDNGSIDAIVSDPPYELGFMGKKWDDTGIAYNVDLWKECLRVLKPGGHLLAFGGTRTYHRMAVAIEDAGFEVRDMLEWIYASGFPKSLNVEKVMNKYLQTGNASWNGTGDSSNGALGYAKLQHKQGYRPNDYSNKHQNKDEISEKQAKQWEGFGTALKPAHEPIIMARKPLSDGGLDIAKTICYNIREKGLITNQNILWRIENVKNVGKQKTKLYSTKIQLPKVVEISAKIVETNENDCVGKQILKLQELMQKSGEKQILSDIVKSEKSHTEQTKKELQNTQKDFNKSESNVSLTLTEENASVAEKQAQSSSLLTISESGEEDTEKNSDIKTSTLGSKNKDFQKKDLDCCVGTATLPTLNMEIARIIKIEFENKEYEFAQLTDGSFVWNNNLTPFREPRPCTIVENVLKHGTGAIDIDGCRIPTSSDLSRQASSTTMFGNGKMTKDNIIDNSNEAGGRFPANILCTDDALNDGVMQKSGKAIRSNSGGYTFGGENKKPPMEDLGFSDSGSKSRYFDIDVWAEKHGLLQFPKASKRERNDGISGIDPKNVSHDGRDKYIENPYQRHDNIQSNFHPTVKPVHLMSWLVRLVSKEKDIVLDPFMGSGTTGVACKLQGRDFIGIELDENYMEIAKARIEAWKPDEQTGLFS